MQICFGNILAHAERHKLPCELLVVEWNPPGGRPLLEEALPWPKNSSFCTVRIIRVPPQIHRRYKFADRLPLYQMIAKNVGIRRARGEFILATTVDLLFSDELFAFLASGSLQSGRLYRVDRCDVERDVPLDTPLEEQLAYCASHRLRIYGRGGVFQSAVGRYLPPDLFPQSSPLQPEQLHIQACGDFQLLSQEDWRRLRGYPEYDIFSWHLDTIFNYAAHFGGAPEENLPPSHCIYHIEHHYGKSDDTSEALWQRYDPHQLNRVSDEAMWVLTGKMVREKRPIIINSDDWGLAYENLAEVLPVVSEWDEEARKGVALYTASLPPASQVVVTKTCAPTAEMARLLDDGITRCLAHRFEEAASIFQRLSETLPGWPDPKINLGCLFWGLGRRQEAIKFFQEARGADPDDQEAAWQLGQAMWAVGKQREAIELYEQYLIRHPEADEIAKQILAWWQQLQKGASADELPLLRFTTDRPANTSLSAQWRSMATFRRQLAQALLLVDDSNLPAIFQSEFGIRYQRAMQGDFKHAVPPDERDLANHLAQKCQDDSRAPGALRHSLAAMLYLYPHEMPVDLHVKHLPPWARSGYWQFLSTPPPCILEGDEAVKYSRYLNRLLNVLCEPRRKEEMKIWKEAALAFAQRFSFLPLFHQLSAFKKDTSRRGNILARLFEENAKSGADHEAIRAARDSRIRLGIFLADTAESAANISALSLLKVDSSFEILVFSPGGANASPTIEEIIARHAALRRLPADEKLWPAALRAEQLDALIFGCDIGVPANKCLALASQRLAWRQIVLPLTPHTTGLACVDAFIVGAGVRPEARKQEDFHERLILMEGSGFCFDLSFIENNGHVQRIDSLKGKTIFFTAAQGAHITPSVQEVWFHILKDVPNSILVAYPFGVDGVSDFPAAPFLASWQNRWQEAGLAEDRLIVLKPHAGIANLLKVMAVCDVYLDAFPYNEPAANAMALTAGIPPIVMEGPVYRFARSAALLRELGMERLITNTTDDYIRLALELGKSAEMRQLLREEISQRMSGIAFRDAKLYGRRIGQALREILG